jgi:hypothetical protein
MLSYIIFSFCLLGVGGAQLRSNCQFLLFSGFTMLTITTWHMLFRFACLFYIFLLHLFVLPNNCASSPANYVLILGLQHDELKPLTKTFTDSLSQLGNLNVISYPQLRFCIFKHGRKY